VKRVERERPLNGAACDKAAALARIAGTARQAADAARREADAAETRLHAAHRTDAANGLRHTLVAGEACPVCEQTVSAPPTATLTPEVEAAALARESAKKRFDEAEAAARLAETALARAEAEFAATIAALALSEGRAAELARSLEAESTDLRRALADRIPEGAVIVERWIEQRAGQLAAARDAHTRAMDERRRAEHAIELAKAAETTSVAALAEKESSRVALEAELRSTREQHAALRAEIAAVAESGDPEAEAARFESRVKSLEDARRRAADEAAPAALRLSAAAETERLHAEAAEAGAATAHERAQTRDAKLCEAGFTDAAEARAAALAPAVIESRERDLQSWERQRHAAQARVVELKVELGDARVSDDALKSAVGRFDDLAQKVENASRESQTLEIQATSMSGRLERSAAMRARLQADEAEYRIHAQLAADLRGDQFQAYVLEEAFSELVQGASTRLLSLTGERYSLLFSDDQILVVDNDNAGETRISDTLSGGETFLASLSLALELSAQVQRAAGAVNLDSLFIDEGFGTLDPETLALVAETIQGLQAGGRMVGIITHIPELRDEFGQQILVTKHEGFSTVEVRAGQ
jgi:exonuclease SbcC